MIINWNDKCVWRTTLWRQLLHGELSITNQRFYIKNETNRDSVMSCFYPLASKRFSERTNFNTREKKWNSLCFFFTGNGGGCSPVSPKKSPRRGSIKLWCLLCMALNIMLLKLLCLKVSMCTLCDPTSHQKRQNVNEKKKRHESRIETKMKTEKGNWKKNSKLIKA